MESPGDARDESYEGVVDRVVLRRKSSPSAAARSLIVVYCPRCDFFQKSAVQVTSELGQTLLAGTHGCVECGGPIEVYVPQELARVGAGSAGEK